MKRILPVIVLFLIIGSVYAAEQKIVDAKIVIREHTNKSDNTFYDAYNNSFTAVVPDYKGSKYYYGVISYTMADGSTKTQFLSLTDNRGTTDPAPTVLLKVNDNNIFNKSGNTVNVPELPYYSENLLGSSITLGLNDNANDNNYNDGEYIWEFSEDGSEVNMSRNVNSAHSYFNNVSLTMFDPDSGVNQSVEFPYLGSRVGSTDTLNFNITNGTYSLNGGSWVDAPVLKYKSSKPIKAPISPISVIISVILIVGILFKRNY
ncbi:hypothetical protein [Methanococcus sp. CF]